MYHVSKIARKKSIVFLGLTRTFSLGNALSKKIICQCIYIPDSKSFKSESAIDSSLINISFPVKHVDAILMQIPYNVQWKSEVILPV